MKGCYVYMIKKMIIEFAGKSFFRNIDRIELCILYLFCFFLSVAFELGESLKTKSYILYTFVENFTDCKILITLLFTTIVVVFHYQILGRKKKEIYCRYLVGDTLSKLTIRYIFECLTILIIAFLIALFIKQSCNLNLYNDFYLVVIFVLYILISASRVKKYENF